MLNINLMLSRRVPVLDFIEANGILSAFSFNGYLVEDVEIGTARGDRRVFLVCTTTDSDTITGCTIGGITATVSNSFSHVYGRMQIVSALVPTGTTADVDFAVSGSTSIYFATYTVLGAYSPTIFDSDNDFAAKGDDFALATNNVDIITYGFVFAFAALDQNVFGDPDDWTGVTYDTFTTVDYGDFNVSFSWASASRMAGELNRAISITTDFDVTAISTSFR